MAMNEWMNDMREFSLRYPGIKLEELGKSTEVVAVATNTAEILIETLPNTWYECCLTCDASDGSEGFS